LITVLKVLLATAGMALLLFYLAADSAQWSQWLWAQRLLHLCLLIIPAILCYTLLLWIMGIRRSHLVH
jgi:peptidoglycan biosynthesis protein MviN/MurJ (putative lipid II flippase)